MTDSSDRELRAETTIEASPDRVWAVLTDLSRLPDWSPELVRMVPLKPGGLREGQWYLGINRRKGVVWPTRNVVTSYQPAHELAWDTPTSGARWIFELEGHGDSTHVLHRRPVPGRLTGLGRLIAATLLGGRQSHANELEAGMQTTLDRLKEAVEGRG